MLSKKKTTCKTYYMVHTVHINVGLKEIPIRIVDSMFCLCSSGSYSVCLINLHSIATESLAYNDHISNAIAARLANGFCIL